MILPLPWIQVFYIFFRTLALGPSLGQFRIFRLYPHYDEDGYEQYFDFRRFGFSYLSKKATTILCHLHPRRS